MDRAQKTSDGTDVDRIGFFGKLPSHGDFVGWGFSRDFEQTVQGFLQGGLQTAANALGPHWENTFAAMPPWRFIVERDLWCNATVAGVLVSSRDRVGRRFPLLVALQTPSFEGHPHQLYQDESWFTAIEAIAETAGQRDFDLDRFTSSLKRLRRLRPGDAPQDSQVTRRRPPTDSLWWSVEPGSRKVRGFRNPGPPRVQDMVTLMGLTVKIADNEKLPTRQEAEPTPAAPKDARSDVDRILGPTSSAADPGIRRHEAPALDTRALGSSLRCRNAYASHPGTRTSLNADALLAAESFGLFAVADGIGDTPGAAYAAKLAVNLLGEDLVAAPLPMRLQAAKGRLGRANGLLFSHARTDEAGPGQSASVVALLVDPTGANLLWAGDARCYLVRHGMMRCLTRDHVALGMSYRLSRAVGLAATLSPEWAAETAEAGDRFLLCSAPLVRLLGERAIAEILIDEDFSRAPASLIENGLIAGGRENLTALCVALDHD